jgi:chromosome segregation ATPase
VTTRGLFPAPRSAPARRLMQLATRLDELRAELRGLRAGASEDAANRAELTAQLHAGEARLYALGEGESQVTSARQKLARLEKSAVERAEKVRVVTDAVATVEGELRRHAADHASALWNELRDDNRRAAERLATAVEGFAHAHAAYNEAGARASTLLHLATPDEARHQRVPDVPHAVAEFARHAGGVEVPVPVPGARGRGHEVARAAEAKAATPEPVRAA